LVVARNQGGHADLYRELRYDRARRTVTLKDSEPPGKDGKMRIVNRTHSLTAEDATRVDRDLFAVCPDAAALGARCAPGGCARLQVRAAGKDTVVEDAATVQNVMAPLTALFPELRKP
jgi:hypothetical protein